MLCTSYIYQHRPLCSWSLWAIALRAHYNVVHNEVMDTLQYITNSWHNKDRYLSFLEEKSLETGRKKYSKNNRFHASSCKKHPISWKNVQNDTVVLLYLWYLKFYKDYIFPVNRTKFGILIVYIRLLQLSKLSPDSQLKIICFECENTLGLYCSIGFIY